VFIIFLRYFHKNQSKISILGFIIDLAFCIFHFCKPYST